MATKLALKRLLKDVSDIYKNPLTEEGIYYKHNETDMMRGHAMIIGPKDTLYQDGVYLFEFVFPKNYPHSPPKVKITSYQENVRINPNLYRSGKVCLSILNNWYGEGWTSCQCIRSLLLTLISILNNEPLLGEPGITTDKHRKEIQVYNKCIHYGNIKYAIIDMFNKENIYERTLFDKEIREHLLRNKQTILDNVERKKRMETLYCSVYNFKVYTDYVSLKKNIIDIYKKIE